MFKLNFLKNSKISLSNLIPIITAIIHFSLVLFHQHNTNLLNFSEFNHQQFCVFFTVKIITFILMILSYQYIFNLIKGCINNSEKEKSILKYFSIYFIPSLILLLLIYPGYHIIHSLEISIHIIEFKIYNFYPLLRSFPQLISFNFFPSLFGISFFCIIFYSFILAYLVYILKNKLNYKYAEIIFIPFFIPVFLVLNTYPFSMVFSAWILLIVFSLIFIAYKLKTHVNNTYFCVILAILSVIATNIRVENIILFFFIPFIVINLKIFNKKNLFIFLLIFFTLFSSLYYIDKKNNNHVYELHNYSCVYYHLRKDLDEIKKPTEAEKAIIEKVFIGFHTKYLECEINTSDKEMIKTVKKLLLKNFWDNREYLLKLNFSRYQNFPDNFCNDYYLLKEHKSDRDYWFKKHPQYNIITNKEMLNYKVIDFIGKKDKNSLFQIYLDTIGNANAFLFMLAVIFIYGIYRRNLFFIHFSIIVTSLFSGLLCIVPWTQYYYIYPCYFSAYWMFMIIIMDCIQYFKDKKQ